MRKLVGTLSAAMMAAAAVVCVPWPASAYNLNCGKFDGPNPTITYRFFDVGPGWENAFNQAQYRWDVVHVPGRFVPTSSSDPMIEVRDGSYADDFWARTSWTCPILPWQTNWIGNEVKQKYNTRTTGSLSAENKKYVAIHELGHAYGLAHESMTCSSGPAVMEQGSEKFHCAGLPPWQDDQNGVIDKY
ncbi:MAG: hypothetical protein J7518_10960 [Nocardioidaceae bacterium]|nr:hypothetical protein [Nocardioidaceae bacterium]